MYSSTHRPARLGGGAEPQGRGGGVGAGGWVLGGMQSKIAIFMIAA